MSKYANLPDIDTAPDVYETEDAAPDTNRRGELDDSDDELLNAAGSAARRVDTASGPNEGIDETGLPSFDSAGRKFGALAALTYTLYPTMTPRSDPTLPSASLPVDDGAHASPTVEHPRARLRRLRYEMDELEQFLGQASETTADTADEPSAKELEEARKTARMMEELKGLQQGLRGLDVKVARPKNDARDGWQQSLKKLEDSIARSASPLPPAAPSPAEGEKEPKAPADPIGKVADLDQRLAVLETVLGTQLAETDDGRPETTPILPTLSKLDHLLTLLTQPRHLDAISRRIKLLLTDLDRAQASSKASGNKRQSLSGGGADGGAGLGLLSPNLSSGGMPTSAAGSSATTLTPAQSQKLEQALQLVPRLQPLLPLLPHLLARLRSLSDLHEAAASFDGTLRGLEQSNARLAAAQKEADAVIGRLEGSIKGNEAMIEGNFRALGARVSEIRRRLAALDGEEGEADS